MMIEIPESIVEDFERIKKHSIEKNKDYFKSKPRPIGVTDNDIVICDMMATYIAFHDLNTVG